MTTVKLLSARTPLMTLPVYTSWACSGEGHNESHRKKGCAWTWPVCAGLLCATEGEPRISCHFSICKANRCPNTGSGESPGPWGTWGTWRQGLTGEGRSVASAANGITYTQ